MLAERGRIVESFSYSDFWLIVRGWDLFWHEVQVACCANTIPYARVKFNLQAKHIHQFYELYNTHTIWCCWPVKWTSLGKYSKYRAKQIYPITPLIPSIFCCFFFTLLVYGLCNTYTSYTYPNIVCSMCYTRSGPDIAFQADLFFFQLWQVNVFCKCTPPHSYANWLF